MVQNIFTKATLPFHLHFGVRLADFDSVVSQAGALPKASCVIDGNTYPAFSDRFIDSQRMTW